MIFYLILINYHLMRLMLSQLEKLRKGEISSSDLDMSKLNEIGRKLNVGMMNIVKKYTTL